MRRRRRQQNEPPAVPEVHGCGLERFLCVCLVRPVRRYAPQQRRNQYLFCASMRGGAGSDWLPAATAMSSASAGRARARCGPRPNGDGPFLCSLLLGGLCSLDLLEHTKVRRFLPPATQGRGGAGGSPLVSELPAMPEWRVQRCRVDGRTAGRPTCTDSTAASLAFCRSSYVWGRTIRGDQGHLMPRYRILSHSEVIRAILLEDSPCCGVPAPSAASQSRR